MDFSTLIAAYRERVDHVLTGLLHDAPFQSSPLNEAMQYGVLLGGKRMRPFLVYATGEMLGTPQAALDIPAAAIECIHAYSLIHDDLPAMDDDTLRRGKPTCHVAFGEDTAILAGDALQTLAFSVLADQPMPEVSDHSRLAMISELAAASGAGGMCGGQALDLAAEGKSVSLQDLETIHRHKTGALIRAAVRLGALSAGERGKVLLPDLDRYANAIGLAFQVQDDILDIVGDTEVIGKRQGADLALGKSTYPALLGLDGAREKALQLYQEAMDALDRLATHSLDTALLKALAGYIIERDK